MSLLTKTFWGVAGTASAVAIGGWILGFMKIDPFASFRSGRPLGETGIRMTDVHVETFDKGKKILDGHIDQVDVRRDRQFYDFKNILGETGLEGKTIDFKSEKGTYDSIARSFQFKAGTSIKTKDLSLFAPQAVFDQDQQTFMLPGIAAGKLMGGDLAVKNASYSVLKGELRTDAIGLKHARLPGVLQDTPIGSAQSKSGWNFESPEPSKRNAGKTVFGRVRASDGEVTVTAEKGELDNKTEIFTFTGKVYYFSKKANFVADRAVVDKKNKHASFFGNIRMLVKPKDKPDITEEIPPFRPDVPDQVAQGRPDPPSPELDQQKKELDDAVRSSENLHDYPALLKGDNVEYWYGKGNRKAIFKGSPECYQDFPGGRWRRLWANTATYYGEEDKLTLESSSGKMEVHVKTSLGDDIYTDKGTFNVSEDDKDVHAWELGPAKGKFMPDEDEVPSDKKDDKGTVTPPEKQKTDPPAKSTGGQQPNLTPKKPTKKQ